MPASGCTIPRWITALTDSELSETIESTGHMAAALYANGLDSHAADQTLDDLLDEHARRR